MSRCRDGLSAVLVSLTSAAALATLAPTAAWAQAAPPPSPPATSPGSPPPASPPPASASPSGGSGGGTFVPPPAGLPTEDPLELAPIDLGTFELAAGGVGAFDHGIGGSAELRAGIIGARVEFPGILASAVTFRAAFQPSLATGVLSGNLLELNEMMFGARYPDLKVCPGFPTVRCDQSTGFLGIGASVLSFAYDVAEHNGGIRIVEGDLVGSVTPAFGKDWSEYRFLPRAGASLDWMSHAAEGQAAFVGRAMLGFDAAFRIGPLHFEPSFRWRPSTGAFVKDYVLEPKLEVYAREAWAAVHNRDAVRVGFEVGFIHASEPENTFNPEIIARATNTLYARLVLAPTIFTFGPPGT